MKKCLTVLLATLLLLSCVPLSASAACGIAGHRVTEPTCTEDGVCRDCGIIYAAFGHRYNDSGICDYCGEKKEVEPDQPTVPDIPDVPEVPGVPVEPNVCHHQWEIGLMREPTCVDDGLWEYYCVLCYERQVEIRPATGEHLYDEYGYCEYCGEQQEPDECRHEWQELMFTEPTCINEGVWERYCTLCYRREVEFFPATGVHIYDDDYDAECNYCGEWREVAPDIPDVPVVPDVCHHENGRQPTCTEEGFCYDCGMMFAAFGHQYTNGCDTDCNLCGYTRWVSDHWYDHQCDTTCNECGFVREPAGNHEYDLNCDKSCNICGYERLGYDHVYSDIYDANCNVCNKWREVPSDGVIYSHPDDVVSESEIHTTLYIEYAGIYYCYWYLVKPSGTPVEMAQGWRLDIVVTRDLNGSRVYCLLKDPATGDTIKRSRAATLHIHVFDNGCDDSCNQCDYMRKKRDHSYSSNCDDDCDECGFAREPEHDYWSVCENECSNCGFIRQAPHRYYADCQKECSWCDYIRENTAPHTYDYPCSEYCKECGEWRDASALHDYDNVCDGSCNVCGAWRDVEPHWYDNDCDPDCNRCGEIRQARYHWYDNDCDPDCNECGALREGVGHQYDDDADQYCNVCGAWRNTETEDPGTDCNHRNAIGATCVGAGYCKDCSTRLEPLGHVYDDDTDFECNNCYYWRDPENECRHEIGEPWCYGGNVNGLHVVVYDCMLCYSTVYKEAELCYGGTATCWDPAQCERCYMSYGDADGDHQYDDENDQECNLCGEWREVVPDVPVVPEVCEHEYEYECSRTCTLCGELTRPDAECVEYEWVEVRGDGVHVMNYECCYCHAPMRGYPEDCYGNEATCDKRAECVVCGREYGDYADHDYNAVVTAPDCINGGYTTYTCCACGDSYVADHTVALGHDYAAVVTAPDCVNDGYTEYTCSVCGDGYIADRIAALGHDYKAATCTAPKTCKVCGATSGSKLSHSYNAATCTKAKTCKNCGVTSGKKLGHTYSNDCDKSCNRCKATRTVAGHDYEKKVTKATLTKNGVIKNICEECGYTSSKTTTIYKISSVKLSTTTYTYTGSTKKPSVTVKDSKGNKVSTSHYTVTYASGRKNVGTYKVTVKFKGNYSGTKTVTFKINPAKTTVKSLTAGTKKLTVNVTKKSTQVTGYQIQYSTSKSFKSYKTKWLTSYKKTSATLTGLSAKKTYYVRVRTYKKVGGKTYYSGWSTIKYKKTK